MEEPKINCFYCGELCEILLEYEVEYEINIILKCPDCGRLVRLKYILN